MFVDLTLYVPLRLCFEYLLDEDIVLTMPLNFFFKTFLNDLV